MSLESDCKLKLRVLIYRDIFKSPRKTSDYLVRKNGRYQLPGKYGLQKLFICCILLSELTLKGLPIFYIKRKLRNSDVGSSYLFTFINDLESLGIVKLIDGLVHYA